MPETFWVVWCPAGCSLPDGGDRPIRHATYQAAYARALEAAESSPGKSVYIMESTDVVVTIHDTLEMNTVSDN